MATQEINFARRGTIGVVAGIGLILLSLVVAYFGGAMASKPELVNQTAAHWMMVIMAIGILVDFNGVADLELAKERA